MVDTITQSARSKQMSLVRSKNTKPEMIIRKLVHGMGFRYRLHGPLLPGRPDLVFPRRRKVVFVHGCFWHRHPDPTCKLARMPKSRLDFWRPKLEGNKLRDERVDQELIDQDWSILTVWECELADLTSLSQRIQSFLEA